MTTKKEFKEKLQNTYVFDKNKNKVMIAFMAIIGAPLFVFAQFFPHILAPVDTLKIFGAIYLCVSAYFFLFGAVNLDKKRSNLSKSIPLKREKLSQVKSQYRKSRLRKKIWEMEFDLRIIGGSVPE